MANESRYRPVMWNMLPIVLFIMGGAGVIALIWSVLNGGPWLFMLFWLGIVAWIGFNGLFRTCYQLEFDETYLYWKGFLRSGRVHVSDIVAFNEEFTGVARIELRTGGQIHVVILQGFAPFLQALAKAHPAIAARPGLLARLAERAQLGFRR